MIMFHVGGINLCLYLRILGSKALINRGKIAVVLLIGCMMEEICKRGIVLKMQPKYCWVTTF